MQKAKVNEISTVEILRQIRVIKSMKQKHTTIKNIERVCF